MRKSLLFTLATLMMAASLQAYAGGGHGHRHGGHSHARVGVYIGAPLVLGSWWLASRPYYPSYYYAPPPVVVRERVVVREPLVYYDERGNPVPSTPPQVAQAPDQAQPPAQSAAPTWFFCADSQAYYPYVQNCASPWQRVIPQPPPQ